MTCLFGCICNQPEQMALALSPVRAMLVAEAPVARWGLGYVHGGETLLSRHPRLQSTNVDFYPAIADLRADYIIGHASAPDALSGNANTQPFRFRKWMFAQDEGGANTTAAQAKLLEHIPDFMRRNIKGKTLSEHVFHVFLAALHKSGSIDDANLAPNRACEALAEALGVTRQVMADTGVTGTLGNLMVSNGRSFLAAHLERPLHMRRLTVPGTKARWDEAFRGVLVVSSTASPGEGFEEIPGQSALLISRDVRTDIVPLPC